MNDIRNLARKSGSDRGSSPTYCEEYTKLFEPIINKKLVILEIGVHQGGSLLMWGEYFKKSKIYGLDDFHRGEVKQKYNPHNKIKCSYDYVVERVSVNKNITPIKGSQGSVEDLDKALDIIGEEIDIIIDDGAHWPDFIDISLGRLFPKLKSGGMYIVEDVSTSEERQAKKLSQKPEHVYEERLIEKLEHISNVKNIYPSNSITDSQARYISKNVLSWKFTDCGNLCTIIKK